MTRHRSRHRCIVLVLGFACLFGVLAAAPATAQTWLPFGASGGGPVVPNMPYPSVVFDEANDRAIAYGGPHVPDVWVLTGVDGTAGTPTWQQLMPTGGPPPSRHAHGLAYDGGSNRLIVFGGCAGGCLPTLNDVWVLTNANGLGGTPQWIPLVPTGMPPAGRAHAGVAYDAGTNRLIVFGGQNGTGFGGATFPEVWVLTNANGLGGTPQWQQLATGGTTPPGQYGPATTYDPARNRLTVFGGGAQGTGNPTNAVWDLDNANGLGGTPVWVNVIPESAAGAPPQTAFVRPAHDLPNNRALYVGFGSSTDVWMLTRVGSSRAGFWSRIHADSPPPSPIGLIAYTRASGRLTVFEPSPGNVWALELPAVPEVILRVNGGHPSPPFVTTTGPVKLTLDVSASRYTGSLSWYWLIIVNGQPLWISAGGVSTTPAPLLTSPPLALSDLTLLDVTLPAGTSLTTVFYLSDGASVVAYDVITADVVAPSGS